MSRVIEAAEPGNGRIRSLSQEIPDHQIGKERGMAGRSWRDYTIHVGDGTSIDM
jgi:hypothetical protein